MTPQGHPWRLLHETSSSAERRSKELNWTKFVLVLRWRRAIRPRILRT